MKQQALKKEWQLKILIKRNVEDVTIQNCKKIAAFVF